MKTLIRSTLIAAAALIISVGPAWASLNCKPYVSGWHMGGPAFGYLVGQRKITVQGGLEWYVGYSYTEEFCVGTYHMYLRDGWETQIELRCDNYTIWGMF